MVGPASHAAPVRWLLAHDPELDALTKAIKLAVVTCVALWLSVDVIGDPAVATFAAFGSVALLLFADFPGDRSARLGAYLLLTVVGALLIVVGTLASRTPWLAVGGMAVVGFAIIFSGVLSAAVAGAGRAGLLAFVLPVTIAAGPEEIPARLAGWGIAAALAIPVAVFIRPPPDHHALRLKALAACAAMADRLGGRGAGGAAGTVDPQQAVDALRTQFGNAAVRPVGLTTGNRLLGRLVSQLTWLRSVSSRVPTDRDLIGRRDEPGGRLLAACGTVLDGCARVLRPASKTGSTAERHRLVAALEDLERARSAAVAAVRFEPGSGADGASVPVAGGLGGLAPDVAHELAYTTAGVGATVAGIAGADSRSLIDRVLGRRRPDMLAGSFEAGRELAVGQASLDSVWLQNALRGGLGLAAAVLIAELTHVSHGFWVVLGTMSVLRTSALTTGATAMRALVGTFVGFLVGAGLVQLLGTSPGPLWAVLPFVIVIAGFLPEAVSFVAGQAAFTVFVVILFNIVQPDGWQIGLVRVEDVALGCAAGLMCGLLLWPRGAAVALRRSLGGAYRASGAALAAAVTKSTDAVDRVATARTAAQRLDAAMRTYLTERAGRRLAPAELATAVTGAERVRLIAGAIMALEPAVDADLTEHVRRSVDWLATAAGAVESGQGTIGPPVPADAAESVLRHVTAVTADEPRIRSAWTVALYLDDAARLEQRVTPALQSLIRHGSS